MAVRNAPAHLRAAYTLNETVPYERFFVDDTDEGQGTHYSYPAADVVAMLESATRTYQEMSKSAGPPFGHRRWGHWVCVQALARVAAGIHHPWSAVVFGSQDPWAETFLLAAGASDVLTVEYNQLTYSHPALRTVTVEALEDQLARGMEEQFDVALSISSFDHDGLGRYGDPLRPEGDLRAMETAWRLLRPAGRLLLSVPVGPDVVVWNLHRRYGERRLPLLLAGWEESARHGWEAARLTAEASYLKSYEPIFVLTRNSTAMPTARLDNSWAIKLATQGSDAAEDKEEIQLSTLKNAVAEETQELDGNPVHEGAAGTGSTLEKEEGAAGAVEAGGNVPVLDDSVKAPIHEDVLTFRHDEL